MNEFPNNPFKKKLFLLSVKLAWFFKLFQNQRLETFYQLFSWNSVGPSKYPIDKMIGLQGHLTVWRVLLVRCALVKNSITEFFSKLINFKIRHQKNFHCRLSNISLHYVTASPSEANSLLPTVQLDFRWTLEISNRQKLQAINLLPTVQLYFSWTLEMSDRQNDRFARPSESLKNFVSTVCVS